MEEYLRRAMLLSRGDPMVLFGARSVRPCSCWLCWPCATVLIPAFSKTSEEAFVEGPG